MRKVTQCIALCYILLGWFGYQLRAAPIFTGAVPVENPSPWNVVSFLEDAGLVRRYVFDISFESDGKVWVAASDGAYRYDGYQWRRFTMFDGLPSDFTRSVKVLGDGSVWVGTAKGAARLENDRFVVRAPESMLAGPSVRRIKEDPDGTLWFCSDRWPNPAMAGGLTSFQNGKWTKFSTADGLPSDHVLEYFRTSTGRQFVFTKRGMAERAGAGWRVFEPTGFSPQSDAWEMVESPKLGLFSQCAAGVFYSKDGLEWEHFNDGILAPLCATKAGEILRGTFDGQKAFLGSWNGASFDTFQSTPAASLGFVDALREAPDGSIWMVANNHLTRWQRSSGEWMNFSKLQPVDDTGGKVWFQHTDGARRLEGSEFSLKKGMRGRFVADGHGALWSWGEDGKIFKHVGENSFKYGVADTGIPIIQRALAGGGGNVWFIGRTNSNNRQVAVFDGIGWQRFALGATGTRSLLSAAGDSQAGIRLCFAGDKANEVVVFHVQRDSPPKYDIVDCGEQELPSGNLITGLDGMWLICNFSLFHFSSEDKKWMRVTPPAGTSVFGAVRGRNKMWFLCDGSTGGGGFASYANGFWKYYPAEDVGDFIGRCHDGTVVISAEDSIYLIENDEQHHITLPLAAKIKKVARDDQGNLWLGIDDGTLCYKAAHTPPRTILTSFSKEERFEGSFHFTALARERWVPQNHVKFGYSWRFDERPWSPFGEIPPQGVSLEGIPGGTHVFEIRARNERGDVDPIGAKAQFTILPAPLQKRAVFRFGLLGAGVLMAGLVFLTIRRAWQISKTNEALRVEIIERERVQEALLQERALLSALMDNIPDRIYFKDAEGRFTRVNRAKALVSGKIHPDELVGKSDRDFFSESDARRSAADEQMVMSSGQPLIGKEEEYVRNDGRTTWVSATKMPLRDKEGKIIGTFGISRDITDMKRAQRDLESQRLEYQTIFDTVPAFVAYKDGYNRHVRVNKYAAELLGRPVEEIAESSVYDLDPQNAPQSHRDDLEVIESGQPKRGIVEQLVTKSGAVRWLLTDKIPYRDLKGQVIGVIVFAIDITEKKIAQEELERAKNDLELRVEARTREISDANATMQKEIRERRRAEDDLSRAQTFLDSVVENLPIPVFIKEARELRFVRWNRAGVELTGYSNDEMLGKNDFDIFPREEAKLFAARDREAITRGELVDIPEEKLQTRYNGVRIMHTRKIPIFDEQGRPLYLLGICEDITGRKQTEVDLKTAKEAAESANKAKSEFLANMSHEIRTPMNGVIGMTNLLLETGLDEEQQDYAQTVRASAESLLTVINDILDFSKIESGKLSFACVDLDLRDVVESTLELLAERARSKGIEIGCLIDNDVVIHLKGDADRLRQVLMNLVGNALKFTAQGEVFVHVSQSANREEDVTLHFEVRDTGIGIDQAAQARLFKAFSQADTSTTRKYGGTGLGLVISQKLIEMMHGKIGVRSAPQQGSTFWFDITLPKQAAGNGNADPLEDSQLTGVRVLVVDDNATNRRIIQHQISAYGMYHEGVESGEEALARLREAAQHRNPFHLVILDMQMAEMDGFSLAVAIKQETQLNQLRLIMLTSMGMRLDAEMMRQAGLEACLIKPVRQTELINAVRAAVSAPVLNTTDNAVTGAPVAPQAALPVRDFRVLLAEDNLVNQKVALRQLQKLGYQVDVVSNGREAVEALRRTPYGIILMDCQMPELDGYEASRRIRADQSVAAESGESSHPIPRIIAMTANAMQGDREKCLAAGMDDYISKPVQISDLKAVLDRNEPKLHVESSGSVVHLNPETIASLRDLSGPDDPSALNEIIGLFEQDAPGCLDSFRKSCAAKDASALKRVAHAFKGSCGNMGADHLAAMCASVEHALQKSAWGEVEGLVAQIQAEYVHVSRELNALRDLTSVS